MRTLLVIPARGGSKGVPRKNVRCVAGVPLVEHAVRAALESVLATEVVTSTDDAEIEEVAERAGSPVMRRPPALATDDAPVVDVVLHVLAEVEAGSSPFDAIVLLQPTSPIRTGADVDAVIRLLDGGAPGVISVCAMGDTHPGRMYRILNGALEPLSAEWETARRQDLPPVYLRNGALYGVRRDVLVHERTLMPAGAVPYVMPTDTLANIDDERDLAIADVLVRRWQEAR